MEKKLKKMEIHNEEIQYLFELADFIIYVGSYLSIVVFTIVYWTKSIYKAACGGNGILQQKEMVKLAAAYAFCGFCIEFIYGHTPFDYGFASMILITIGISMETNLNKVKLPKLGGGKKKLETEE